MATYTCLLRVDHNHQLFEPGQAIELTEDQAKQLLEFGAIEPLEPAPKPKKAAPDA